MVLSDYSAVIFDMDGVIVDNHHAHFKAWMSFSKTHNFTLNNEIYLKDFNGKTNRDLFEMIFGNISEEKFNELVNEKEKMYQEIFEKNLREHKGLTPFLKNLRERGMKIAVGTSAPPMNVDFILDRLRIRNFFDVVIDGLMVKKGKPDPEIYIKCKELLEVKSAIVIEDAFLGIEAGKRAQCAVIGMATTHSRQELEGKVDLIVSDFEEALIKLE